MGAPQPHATPRLSHRRLANTDPARPGGPTAPALCWTPGLFRLGVLLELYTFSEQLGRLRGTETRAEAQTVWCRDSGAKGTWGLRRRRPTQAAQRCHTLKAQVCEKRTFIVLKCCLNKNINHTKQTFVFNPCQVVIFYFYKTSVGYQILSKIAVTLWDLLPFYLCHRCCLFYCLFFTLATISIFKHGQRLK